MSQAIRFLVANDFLKGVEMKPGQANERLIEVIGNSTTETRHEAPDSEAVEGSVPSAPKIIGCAEVDVHNTIID